jgi:hypothetical protein
LCLGVKGSGGGYQRFGLIWGVDMQDPGYELRRIPLPRTPVNRGKKERAAGQTGFFGSPPISRLVVCRLSTGRSPKL